MLTIVRQLIFTIQQSVFVFPEGTRSYFSKADLLPFKRGAFHLAIQAGVPIVPIVVGNYSHVLQLQAMSFESGTIDIRGMPPLCILVAHLTEDSL